MHCIRPWKADSARGQAPPIVCRPGTEPFRSASAGCACRAANESNRGARRRWRRLRRWRGRRRIVLLRSRTLQNTVSEHPPTVPTQDLGLAIPHRRQDDRSIAAALARACCAGVLPKGVRCAVLRLPRSRNNQQHDPVLRWNKPRMFARKVLRLNALVHVAIGRARNERH